MGPERRGPDIESLLTRVGNGCPEAEAELYAIVYRDLHARAGRELARLGPGDSLLQPTAVVNEAYLRLRHRAWKDERHFAAVCARAMRSVILDSYRRRNAARRIPSDRLRRGVHETELAAAPGPADAEHIVLLDRACTQLAERSPEAAQLVELRYFTDLTVPRMSKLYGVPQRTMERRLSAALAMVEHLMTTLEEAEG